MVDHAMPSGRTHDSITLWSLPLIAGVTFERTRSSSLALLVSAGFLFSGLMFGPDLDIYSRQYKRWGPLRWIWLPYRKVLRHRSFLSHGPIVGTLVRIGYLLLWLGLFGLVAIGLGTLIYQALGLTRDWQLLTEQVLQTSGSAIGRSLQQFPLEWVTVVIGLELGALSHTLSDWAGSALKRIRKRRKQSVTQSDSISDSDDSDDSDDSTAIGAPVEEFDPLAREPLTPAINHWTGDRTDDWTDGLTDGLTEDDSDLIDLLNGQYMVLPIERSTSPQSAATPPQSPPDYNAPSPPQTTPPPRKPESWKGPELPPFVGK